MGLKLQADFMWDKPNAPFQNIEFSSQYQCLFVHIEELYCVYCADWAGEDNKEHGWSQFSAQIRRDKGNLRAAAGNRVQIDADREMNGRFRVSN